MSRQPQILPTPSFLKKAFRKVLDAEGRVFEPLECGHHWMLRGTFAASRIKVEEGFGIPSPDHLEDAALKFLQPAPTRPSLSRKDVFRYCPTGWVPEEASIGPTF